MKGAMLQGHSLCRPYLGLMACGPSLATPSPPLQAAPLVASGNWLGRYEGTETLHRLGQSSGFRL